MSVCNRFISPMLKIKTIPHVIILETIEKYFFFCCDFIMHLSNDQYVANLIKEKIVVSTKPKRSTCWGMASLKLSSFLRSRHCWSYNIINQITSGKSDKIKVNNQKTTTCKYATLTRSTIQQIQITNAICSWMYSYIRIVW